jgi:4-diphosphocytidyl-2C-methyl-D-erythritol kinase
MSGSGSTVFGIFQREAAPELPNNSNYFIKIIN